MTQGNRALQAKMTKLRRDKFKDLFGPYERWADKPSSYSTVQPRKAGWYASGKLRTYGARLPRAVGPFATKARAAKFAASYFLDEVKLYRHDN